MGLVLACWGVLVPIVAVAFPFIFQWPTLVYAILLLLVNLAVAVIVHSLIKTAFLKKDADLLASIKNAIRQYREEMDRNAEPYSRSTILAYFAQDCRDFVEYVLDHEASIGTTTRDYQEVTSLDTARNQLQEKDSALKLTRKRLEESNAKLQRSLESPITDFVSTIAETRRETNAIAIRKPGRIITDPVFHEMYLEPELNALLQHPLLDRLRSLKQLSFTYQEQPTALHTRLTHSLGVARNVEFALQRIFDRAKLYVLKSENSGEVMKFDIPAELRRRLFQLAKTAALLHDLGHAPFGHSLDRFTVARLCQSGTKITEKPDKYYSSKYVRSHLAESLRLADIDANALAYIISPSPELYEQIKNETWTPYLSLITAIIDSELDADRIDFLIRDSHSTGLPYGLINAPALLSSMLPTQESGSSGYGIAFDRSAVGLIGHAVHARINMYENCYETPAKIASETMLTNALRGFLDTHASMKIEDLLVLTDDELLAVMLGSTGPGDPVHKLAELLVKQQYFSRIIEPIRMSEHRGALECDRYLMAATGDDAVIEQYAMPLEWQERLARTLSDDEKWMVEVYATPYDRFEIKEQQIRIIQEKDGTFEYSTLAEVDEAKDIIQMLAQRVRRNPRIEVFAHQALGADKLARIREAAKHLFY